jgi:signal transduction histidine kinase
MLKIIHPLDLLIYEDHLKHEHNGLPCKGIDFRIISKTKELKWINHVCQPVYDVNGNFAGRRGSNSDITARKFAEEEISRLYEELKELNADKDRFISILGHDLKSAFNSLLGMSELLSKEIHKLSKEKIRIFAGQIYETATNTYDLLSDILMWANSKQGKIPYRPLGLDLYEVCEGIVNTFLPLTSAKNITIDYSGIVNKNIYADPDMLKAIIRNLISNSIKFTNRNGMIFIYTELTEKRVKICVKDNGVGISKKNFSKLLSITEVLSTSGTENETGTGLGLLLCKDFIERNGGEIKVESEEGKGCLVSFDLQNIEN